LADPLVERIVVLRAIFLRGSPMLRGLSLLCLSVVAVCGSVGVAAHPEPAPPPSLPPEILAAPVPVATAAELKTPYDRYEVKDGLGRVVTYYVSKPKIADSVKRPIVLFIQGSGCNSLFVSTPDGRVGGGMFNMMYRDFGDRVRVMVVEKPGVKYLENPMPPGAATGCSAEFRNEHTVERWVAALDAALAAAKRIDGVDASRTLAIGHSEGSDMAAHLAAYGAVSGGEGGGLPVTHAACLSGAGITQLFDMMQIARRERVLGEAEAEREARVNDVLAQWERIERTPDSAEELAWGHPHKRWSSFCRKSPVESMLAMPKSVKLFLAHGTRDEATPIEGFDACIATLAVHGREATIKRIAGGDHALATPGQSPGDALAAVLGEAVGWFLKNGEAGGTDKK
jgi:predicted esterase